MGLIYIVGRQNKKSSRTVSGADVINRYVDLSNPSSRAASIENIVFPNVAPC